MATQTINTRIKNKIDTLQKWEAYTGTLLNGEIAIVRVDTDQTQLNPITGKTEPVAEFLMKVGDGSTAFENLPWVSAKAADVFSWAKTQEAKDIEVVVTLGTTSTKKTLGTWLKESIDKSESSATQAAAAAAAVDVLNGSNTVPSIVNLPPSFTQNA